MSKEVIEIPIEQIIPKFPDTHGSGFTHDLREKVEKEVILEPITVRKGKKGYHIQNGHHRYWIAKSLGYKTMKCVVYNG